MEIHSLAHNSTDYKKWLIQQQMAREDEIMYSVRKQFIREYEPYLITDKTVSFFVIISSKKHKMLTQLCKRCHCLTIDSKDTDKVSFCQQILLGDFVNR